MPRPYPLSFAAARWIWPGRAGRTVWDVAAALGIASHACTGGGTVIWWTAG